MGGNTISQPIHVEFFLEDQWKLKQKVLSNLRNSVDSFQVVESNLHKYPVQFRKIVSIPNLKMKLSNITSLFASLDIPENMMDIVDFYDYNVRSYQIYFEGQLIKDDSFVINIEGEEEPTLEIVYIPKTIIEKNLIKIKKALRKAIQFVKKYYSFAILGFILWLKFFKKTLTFNPLYKIFDLI